MQANDAARWNAPVPEGLREPVYRWSVAAAQLCGASVGVQLLIALVLRIGPLAPWPEQTTFTHIGRSIVHPEYDVPAYVLGCVICLVSIAANLTVWRRLLLRVPAERRGVVARWGTVIQTACAFISAAAFLSTIEVLRRTAYNRWQLSPVETALVFAPPVFAVVALLVARQIALRPADSLALAARFYGVTRHYSKLSAVLIAFAAAAIVAMVYVPFPGHLAGAYYTQEEFFHWDHFLMAPALGFASGKALGTDIPLQYGVGGPLLFGAAKEWFGLSYEGMLHACVVYACAYFVGVFALLRLAFRNTVLALGATMLGIWLTMWAPVFTTLETVWQWPSSTLLRSPFDVWFLLALFLDARRQTPARVVAAGAITGLALVFNTDSGASMLIVFAVYSVWRTRVHRRLMEMGAAWLLLSSVVVALLWAASRGTIWTRPRTFFSGWLDGVVGYAGSGAGSLVFLSRVHMGDIVLLMLVSAIYLVVVAHAMRRAFEGRLTHSGVVLACASLYGLARLVIFYQRTLPNNLYHTAIPALLVAGLATGPWLSAWGERVRPWRPLPPSPVVRGMAGGVLLVFAASLLWASPAFHEYPSVLRVFAKGAPVGGVTLIKGMDVQVPEDWHDYAQQVQAGVDMLKKLNGEGARVAVIDNRSTLYYLASGITPWRGDSTLFYNTYTLEQQRQLTADLVAAPLDYVFLSAELPGPYFDDTWRACRAVVQSRYTLTGRVGLFEVWKRTV